MDRSSAWHLGPANKIHSGNMAEIEIVRQDFQLENALAWIIAQYAGDEYCAVNPCTKHDLVSWDENSRFIFKDCEWQPPDGYERISKSGRYDCNGYFIPPINFIYSIFKKIEIPDQNNSDSPGNE